MDLLANEKEIAITRQHPIVLFTTFLGSLFFIIIAIAINFIPSSFGSTYHLTSYRGWVILFLVVCAVIYFFNRFLRWYYTTYNLTDHRLVRQNGIFSRITISIDLHHVQNIDLVQPFGLRLLSAGNIFIESAGRDGKENYLIIPKAKAFYNQIETALEQTEGSAEKWNTP